MNTRTLRPVLNLLAVIVTIAINGLADALPINNLGTGEISDRFQVYFVPAGYVFAIWGLIYLGLLAFGIYQALPAQRDNPRLARIGWLFIISCVANCAWIFLWHYLLFTLTGLVILILLACLIGIYLRLGIGQARVSTAERLCVDAPFSLYLGWVSVATIANLTDVFNTWGVSGTGPAAVAWAVALLAVGVVLAAAMRYLRGDAVFGAVIVWAFIGIAVKQAGTPPVATAAWVGAALVAVALVVLSLPQLRFSRPAGRTA
jgi:translocator protein